MLRINSGNTFDIYAVHGVKKETDPQYFLKNGAKNHGTLTRLGNGHYQMLFAVNPYMHKKCSYSLQYRAKYAGWSLRSLNKACVFYHGANWGYGTPVNTHLLKKLH